MSTGYRTWAEHVRRLYRALGALEPSARSVGVAPPAGQEWFELLRNKLLPQLDEEPFLVVAVVGGTNIGKSVLFNQLAGETASAVSPLAAGTKHPVCLVPPGISDPQVLARLFEDFRLCAWQSADDPLDDSEEHRLFWRTGRNVPPRLLLLDAPDVDSDVQVNWRRARALRRAADVLIAVLTQQKYNDAAVKQFFREAVEADKPIIAVFNQCDLEADACYWPQWLETFCSTTGAKPELVYVAPYDRAAAECAELPLFEVGSDGHRAVGQPAELRHDLAALHFDEIKIRTFRGALVRVLDQRRGLGGYLADIRGASGQFRAAAEVLSATEMARVAWPALPASVLVEEIRRWWDADRHAVSRGVHGFYRALGRGVTWPIRAVWRGVAGETADPLDTFQSRERQAVVLAVGKLIDELDRLAQIGNDTLRPRLAALLSGNARATLLEQVQAAHDRLEPVDDDYRKFVAAELNRWKEANPRAVSLLRSMDHVLAFARPAITVSLAVSGFVLAGDLVGQAAAHAAGSVATEAAIAGGITGGGEAVVSTTSEGIRHAAARLFRRLQERYAQRRAAWLAAWLEDQLLGPLLSDLRNGAQIPEGGEFHAVEQAADAVLAMQD